MTISIDISVDTMAMDQKINEINREIMPKVLVRALNRTASNVKAEGVRRVRKTVKLKASEIRKRTLINKAAKSAFLENIFSEVVVVRKSVPLIQYGARRRKKGVAVNVKGSRKIIPKAFITKMKSGHEGVFVRLGKGRLPIQELFSTSVADTYEDSGVLEQIRSHANERFQINFAADFKFFSSKLSD